MPDSKSHQAAENFIRYVKERSEEELAVVNNGSTRAMLEAFISDARELLERLHRTPRAPRRTQ